MSEFNKLNNNSGFEPYKPYVQFITQCFLSEDINQWVSQANVILKMLEEVDSSEWEKLQLPYSFEELQGSKTIQFTTYDRNPPHEFKLLNHKYVLNTVIIGNFKNDGIHVSTQYYKVNDGKYYYYQDKDLIDLDKLPAKTTEKSNVTLIYQRSNEQEENEELDEDPTEESSED